MTERACLLLCYLLKQRDSQVEIVDSIRLELCARIQHDLERIDSLRIDSAYLSHKYVGEIILCRERPAVDRLVLGQGGADLLLNID